MPTTKLVLLATLLASCTSPENKLRPRAATDLHCPAQQLVLTPRKTAADRPGEMQHTWDVSGCGRSAAYQYSSSDEEWRPEPLSP
jgi:hypothetical protein